MFTGAFIFLAISFAVAAERVRETDHVAFLLYVVASVAMSFTVGLRIERRESR